LLDQRREGAKQEDTVKGSCKIGVRTIILANNTFSFGVGGVADAEEVPLGIYRIASAKELSICKGPFSRR